MTKSVVQATKERHHKTLEKNKWLSSKCLSITENYDNRTIFENFSTLTNETKETKWRNSLKHSP